MSKNASRLGPAWLLLCTVSLAMACGSSGDSGGGDPDGSANPDGGPGVDSAPPPATVGVFNEDFSWKGKHAAVLNSGKGTAVWWNADNWDVTGDTHAIGVMGEWYSKPTPNAAGGTTDTNSGHAIYVHKAAKPCEFSSTTVCESGYDDATLVPGGDGSPGVGVMHLDEQDIIGARLRNPISITEDKPGIVRLRAPRFVTMGHWWEIGLTPADRVIGSENTVVESQGQGDGLAGVGDPPNEPGKGAGPGHDPQEESFNVVVTGSMDHACETEGSLEGSLTRLAVKSLVKNGKAAGGFKAETGIRYNTWTPKSIFDDAFHGTYAKDLIRPGLDGRTKLPASFLKGDKTEDPIKVAAANVADQYNLYLWQFEFRPSGVDVKADLNDGAGLVLLEHFNLGVPWNSVYVHLMTVAYQNDHHPQVEKGCPYLPVPFTQREMRFRTITIGPVQYTKTAIFPPDGAPTDASGNVMLCDGKSCGRWMRYDMRDTHNFGAPDSVTVGGVASMLPKANPAKFSFVSDYAHGSNGHFEGGLPAEPSFDLYVPISDDVKGAKAANFVYNAMGAKGVANLIVNGHAVGVLPTADSVVGASVKNDIHVDPGCPAYDCMSVRRSLAIDPALLTKDAAGGLAHIQVVFDPKQLGSGTFIDRIQLELLQ